MCTGRVNMLERIYMTDPGLVHSCENCTTDHGGIVMNPEEEEKKPHILSIAL